MVSKPEPKFGWYRSETALKEAEHAAAFTRLWEEVLTDYRASIKNTINQVAV